MKHLERNFYHEIYGRDFFPHVYDIDFECFTKSEIEIISDFVKSFKFDKKNIWSIDYMCVSEKYNKHCLSINFIDSNKHSCSLLFIQKGKDEWFIINYGGYIRSEGRDRFYKCDQIDGVIQNLKDFLYI